jgi:hypothetical protein
MKRIALFGAAALAAVAFSVSASAQRARGYASQQAGSAPADFTEGNLNFHRSSSGFMQVTDTAKNQSAGTVIFPPNQPPMFASMPGYDIKPAYEKHMNGGGAPAAADAANAPKDDASNKQNAVAPTPETGFNAATKTVTLSGARTVTFVDGDNLKVTVPGAGGDQVYDVTWEKGSVGKFFKSWAATNRGYGQQGSGAAGPAGGSFKIILEASNGMRGGVMYDSSIGVAEGNIAPSVTRVQPVVTAVNDAVNEVKPVQPDLAKTHVVKAVLNNLAVGPSKH